jgi:hypothetical protein
MAKCKKRCGRRVRTKRSTLCLTCFNRQAIQSGAQSAGNAKGNAGNAGNANAKGNAGNAGNAKGNAGNAGNAKKGTVKKRAGKRSGLKRSSKVTLVVKKRWLDLILAGDKDWEIRNRRTTRRGWIHFAQSQAGGKLIGRARLVDCLSVPRSSFMKHVSRHCVTSLSDCAEVQKYKSIFAWVLEDAERFKSPFVYKHTPGAMSWAKV